MYTKNCFKKSKNEQAIDRLKIVFFTVISAIALSELFSLFLDYHAFIK